MSRAETDLANAKQYESDLKWYQDQEAAAKSDLATKNQTKDYYANLVDNLNSQIGNVENTNADYLSVKKQREVDPEN